MLPNFARKSSHVWTAKNFMNLIFTIYNSSHFYNSSNFHSSLIVKFFFIMYYFNFYQFFPRKCWISILEIGRQPTSAFNTCISSQNLCRTFMFKIIKRLSNVLPIISEKFTSALLKISKNWNILRFSISKLNFCKLGWIYDLLKNVMRNSW